MSVNPNNVAGITIPGPLTATANQAALTGMCWFKLDALPTVTGAGLFIWGTNVVTTRFGAACTITVPNKIRCTARGTDSDAISNFDTVNNVLTPGLWQHVAFSLDFVTKNALIYVNGVSEPVTGTSNLTGNATSNTNSTSAKIGCDINNASFIDGVIEDVRLYQRLVSAAEIMTIFTARGRDGIVQGLASRYPCNDLGEGQAVITVANIGPIDRVSGIPVNTINFDTTILTPRKSPQLDRAISSR